MRATERQAHHWTNDYPLTPAPEDAQLEHDLGWAKDTIAVLRAAFALNLSRYTPWQHDGQAKFQTAARYFRRGIVSTPRPKFAGHPIPQYGDFTNVERMIFGRFVLIDHNVARLHTITGNLKIGAHEDEKTLTTVAKILKHWRAAGKPRHWTVIGGGVILDLCGFAAALVGTDLTLVPTTLLAMIDACIGGKTGVNFSPYGKNQIGTFYFPKHIFISTKWLATLPKRELRAASWECIKHALIANDTELLNTLLTIFNFNAERIVIPTSVLQKLQDVKLKIVERDPYDLRGERMKLNLGHTLAHALEATSHAHEPLSHGEAVGLGLIYAFLLSKRLQKMHTLPSYFPNLCASPALLSRTELATRLGTNDLHACWAEISTYIAQDKKNRRWLVMDEGGEIKAVKVSEDILAECWRQFLQHLR